ncbi:MAG TPA: arginase family protein [Longimicrobiales bacterium]|nr:arginase family protein [Longimicrobiales bacterium]
MIQVRSGTAALMLTVVATVAPMDAAGQSVDAHVPMVAVIQMPFTGERNVAEISDNPGYLFGNGIADSIRAMGFILAPGRIVGLDAEDERAYGSWHRMGLANGHLAEMVAENGRSGAVTVGLLANCTSILGVLGGLQHSGEPGAPRSVGLVYIDAHGDFNVPETTLSGMLGGMPVAVAAGMALHNLRRESGLDPGIPTDRIVMAGVRDMDPLEAELVAAAGIRRLSSEDIAHRPDRVREEVERLAGTSDVIFVHVDMDVLDPAEVPGHSLAVPDGPTSQELAAALAEMFREPKVVALGIASTPANERDPDRVSLAAAYNLIKGALVGVRGRPAS